MWNFNPRTHVECDDAEPVQEVDDYVFQSTHSRRVRRYHISIQEGI